MPEWADATPSRRLRPAPVLPYTWLCLNTVFEIGEPMPPWLTCTPMVLPRITLSCTFVPRAPLVRVSPLGRSSARSGPGRRTFCEASVLWQTSVP